jgi:hypothetical protein
MTYLADTISSGIETWLTQEWQSGLDLKGSEFWLGDLDRMRLGLGAPLHDPINFAANKAYSHANQRYGSSSPWVELVRQDPSNDYGLGRMVYSSLMTLAAARSLVGYASAYDQEEFELMKTNPTDAELRRRYDMVVNRVSGIEVEECSGLLIPDVGLEDVLTSGLGIMGSIEDFYTGSYEGSREYEQVATDFALDWIIFSAGLKSGDITAVPVLEAKSITADPKTLSPPLFSS